MIRDNESLIATLQRRLREARAARGRLAAQLSELEHEIRGVRAEIAELETLAAHTEGALRRLFSTSLGDGLVLPSDADIERAIRLDFAKAAAAWHDSLPLPPRWVETQSTRFMDRNIVQASTILLREAQGPLHVNEIYKRMVAGGFKFTGENPTISVAVSLNRNARFRKVAPGTFDLIVREASQASGE